MVAAVDIRTELAGRPVIDRDSRPEEVEAAFATLADFRDGGVFAGSFRGDSPWERHGGGDELVHILAGSTTLTILTDDGAETLAMSAGTMTVVPQGCWHRFSAPEGVTVMTATPQPTDHSDAEDPRAAG